MKEVGKVRTINDMTRKEFEAVPHCKWDETLEFHSLVILPTRQIHDSGHRCMDFVACSKAQPVMRLSGYSDVIHINGIGGYGFKWLKKYGTCPNQITPVAWSIDCLKTSGLLQLFAYKQESEGYCRTLTNSPALSSFEIFITDKTEPKSQ